MLLNPTPIIFYGGKGGVGKTTLAAATATHLAQTGKNVLLVSTDPAHNIGHLFGQKIGPTPTRITTIAGLDAIEIDPEETTQQHLKNVRHTMQRMLPEHLHKQITQHINMAAEAPGTHEAAILERIAQLTTSRNLYDHIVFDTAPSGHTSRLLALPELMTAWTEGLLKQRDKSHKLSRAVRGLEGRDAHVVGTSDEQALDPIDRRDRELRRILTARRALFVDLANTITNPHLTSFSIVLHAERIPVAESVELYHTLNNLGVNVAGFIINRISPTDQGKYLAERRALEDTFIAELHHQVPHLPITKLPLLAGEVTTTEQLTNLINAAF
ncbi:ArsA family ATPase [Corynebacterium aquilae]|uniref:AAA+ ATPase domain-containing protein n=1 Tax=Corynebacterium aquilae DSM 44791 TaxID=1431546 RepID=A0A1L7CI93_9CORY|nr:ArsA family ATPase [Corynebacterium aquilae]APT85493.1 hypothetical protein CAQU_11005 [Corynebacterium aquilae DSM 44791]